LASDNNVEFQSEIDSAAPEISATKSLVAGSPKYDRMPASRPLAGKIAAEANDSRNNTKR